MLQSRMSVEDEEAVQAELAAMEAEQVRALERTPTCVTFARGASLTLPRLPLFVRYGCARVRPHAQTRAREGPREQKTVLPDVPASEIPAVREDEQDEQQPEQGEHVTLRP